MKNNDDDRAATNKRKDWVDYFDAKKKKIEEQFERLREERNEAASQRPVSSLFKTVAIFVNGFTIPSNLELKELMLKHGGTYCEFLSDRVTHIVASNLAYSKATMLKNYLIVKPEWILDSIQENKILDTDKYELKTHLNQDQAKLTKYFGKNAEKSKSSSQLVEPCSPVPQQKTSTRFYKATSDIALSQVVVMPKKKQQQSPPQPPPHFDKYTSFQDKLKAVVLPSSRHHHDEDLEIERIKHLLDDWIFWTSKHLNDDAASKSLNDDLEIFKGYLAYLLETRRDWERVTLVLRLFKRLVQHSTCSRRVVDEWYGIYKDVESSVQANFYEKFNTTLAL